MMDRITFMRVVRAVQREAATYGFSGDIFAAPEAIPLIGTYQQQLAIASIRIDTQPGPMSNRDRRLHDRLVRAAVLTSPVAEPSAPQPKPKTERPRKW